MHPHSRVGLRAAAKRAVLWARRIYYEKGLNIYRYELKANSKDEIAGIEQIASVPSAVSGTNKFGIQLFDGTGKGELDTTKYGFYAVPYIVIDGVETELSLFGDNGVGADPEEGQTRGDVFIYQDQSYNTATEPVAAE